MTVDLGHEWVSDHLPWLRRPRPFASPGAVAELLDPTTVETEALRIIDAALLDLYDGDTDRLMIFMPPQEGKSVRVSKRFVEFALADDPTLRVAIVSYTDSMARRWGSDIKLDVETFTGHDGTPDLGLTLRRNSQAAGSWQLEGHQGGLYCVGVGGSLTGRPADLLIIDDPIKDLEQAQSFVYRERAWRFWQAVAIPRMAPTTKVVLIQTRWHEDDLAGRLLASENAARWKVLSIPAVSETTDDPLGRPIGQAMESARGDRDWHAIRTDVGEYVWAALYQQRPAPAAGGLFKRDDLRHWQRHDGDDLNLWLGTKRVIAADLWRFMTVDLAMSTKTSADYTAAAVWGLDQDGALILLDGIRERLAPSDHWPAIRRLVELWNVDTVYLEGSQFGTTLAYEAGAAGVPLAELKADTDKFSRALPAAARAETGRLWLPQADTHPWVTDWVDELVAFPNAVHDDTVDVVAYAARVAIAHWLPAESGAIIDQRRALQQRADQAVDFMTAPM